MVGGVSKVIPSGMKCQVGRAFLKLRKENLTERQELPVADAEALSAPTCQLRIRGKLLGSRCGKALKYVTGYKYSITISFTGIAFDAAGDKNQLPALGCHLRQLRRNHRVI